MYSFHYKIKERLYKMSETKMKLEIEFESFEDLDRKLSSAL